MTLVEENLSQTRARRVKLAEDVTAAKREHSYDLEQSELAKSKLDKMEEKVKIAKARQEAAEATHAAAERDWKEQRAALQEAESTSATSARNIVTCEVECKTIDAVISDLHFQLEAWRRFLAAASMLGRTASQPVATSSSDIENSGSARFVTEKVSTHADAGSGNVSLKDACAVGVHAISLTESSSSTVRGNVESGCETSQPEGKSDVQRPGKTLRGKGSVVKKTPRLKSHIRRHSGMGGGDAMEAENDDDDGVEDDGDKYGSQIDKMDTTERPPARRASLRSDGRAGERRRPARR